MIRTHSFLLRFVVCCAFVLATSQSFAQMISSEATAHKFDPKQRVERAFRASPLPFEANQGQAGRGVQYLSRGSGYTLFLSGADAVLVLRRPGAEAREQAIVRLVLEGANAKAQLIGDELLPGRSRYFSGKDSLQWLVAPHYRRVHAVAVYPGVDLIYYGNQQQLEADFVVAPNVDLHAIAWRIEGAQKLRIDARGDLLLSVPGGQLVLHAPVLYQNYRGGKVARSGRYVLRGPSTVGFEVAAYDRTRSLTIDPVLSYSSYLGNSSTDSSKAIAVDGSGNLYIVGTAASAKFPAGSPSTLAGASTDAFVAKMSPDGSSLLYSAYLTGSASSEAHALAVDSEGNAYITGATNSADFPVLNALQPSCSLDASGVCAGDTFLAKLDPQGALVYSTYFGGSGKDNAAAIAVDGSGNVFVAGATDSVDLPVVAALQWSAGGSGDAFVAKIAGDGSRLLYSSYLGGSGTDEARGIATDAAGNAYLTGSTSSLDFPTRAPLQANCSLDSKNLCSDTFITKISADGSKLVYSTYLGGGGADAGNAIAVDSSGNAYVAGETLSGDFPVVKPFQSGSRGLSNAFVSKLASGGSSLLYSTYLGGSGEDRAYAITMDRAGNAFVVGVTHSSDFPMKDPVQETCKKDSTGACSEDAFVAVLDPKGATLEFGTYLGGSGADEAHSIALDAQGSVYLTGTTTSADFPSATSSQLSTSTLLAQANSINSGSSSTSSGGGFVAKITGVSVAGSSGTPTGPEESSTYTNCTGTTTNWLGGTGNWSNAAMWSTGVVPNSTTANVCIDGGQDAASQVTLDLNVSVGSITIDANDTLIVNDNINFVVAGGISNSGQILLNGGGYGVYFRIANGRNVALTGGGTITMSNAGYNILCQQAAEGGSTLTNVDNTIRGAGQIGWNGLALVNQASGIINANFASTTVGVLINASSVTNAGLIEATGGGLLQISPVGQVTGGGGNPTVNNSGGSIVSNGTGSQVQISSTTIQGGTLNTLSGGVLGTPANAVSVVLDGNTHGTLANAGTYSIFDNTVTILVGTINNTGSFQMNGAGYGSYLQIATGQNVTLTGGGRVILAGGGYNIIHQQTQGGNSILTNVNNTIQGAGQIGWNGLVLVNQSSGIINSDGSIAGKGILLNAPTVTNAGLMEATGGGVLAISSTGQVTGGGGNPTVNNSGATILSSGSGSQVQFSSATIQGGTLNTLNGGVLGTGPSGANNVVLDGSTHGNLSNAGTYTTLDNTVTILAGTINNTGSFQMNGTSYGSWLQIATGQNVTLTGGGAFNMAGTGYNIVHQQAAGGGSTLTNVNNTIHGAGQIGWNGLILVNQSSGTIDADTASTALLINASSVTNAGLVEASGGGILTISPAGQTTGGGGNPTVNNTGGSILSNGSGSQVLFSSTTIQGGALNTLNSGVLGTGPSGASGVILDGSAHGALTNAGAYTAVDNTITILTGTINNTGSFQLNGSGYGTFLQIATGQTVTVTGTGTIILAGTGNSFLAQQTSGGGSTLINGASHTIQGNGHVGWNGLALVNNGTILANSTNGMVISATTFTNNGTVQTNNLCPLSINTGNALMTNTGNVIVNSDGTMVVFGTYTQTAGGTRVDGSLEADLLNINAGTLFGNGGTITGPINLAGVLRPGDTVNTAGLLSISGTYSQTSAGAYNVVIGGLSPGTQFGRTNITSTAGLSGTLNASLINGFNPVAGNSFTVMSAGSLSGSFSTANLPALTCGGVWQVSYTSTTTVLNVVNPAPAIASLSPSSKIAGDAAFTLTVNGSGFVCGSVVNFNGNARTTTFVSPTQLTVSIPVSDIATAGVFNVTVTNPAPGGGTSAPVSFTVNNPVPAIATVTPSSTLVGSAGFTLTINGTGFVSTSTVSFNGNSRTTTFVSSTQLNTSIPASDIATAGVYNVTVFNPTPGGGTSNAASFTVNNPVPTVTTISPATATAGGAGFTLTVNGTNFLSTSTIRFNGTARTTTFVSATQLTAAIPASDIATGGTFNVTVTNPTPGGGTSNAATFTVNNPVPTITTLSPANATAGSAGFSLTINGTNFVTTSAVSFNGIARTTTYVSATQLTAVIPASDIAAAGSYNVTVTNPTPGGGTSNPVAFTVNNPVPAITTISPTSATVGGAAFTLTVNGTGFVSTSVVRFSGSARTTTFVSATQLTAAIPASDITAAGTYNVTVNNPTPGGGTSNAVTFAVNNPVPTITTLSPSSATAGGTAFTLTVNGTNFVSASTVRFNGNARTTTFVSATQLTAAIPASDIATAGSYNVTVSNPTPGGGTSSAVAFTVNNPVPTITTISPSNATAGGAAFTLTVNGTNFLSSSTVRFNGNARTTTFVSATQLTAAILASDIATGGTSNVTVTNPTPGGGASNSVTFTVNNPAPTITTISPTGATVGGAAFTLTVNGTGFVSSSTVSFNGTVRTTTFVGATQLTAAIPASDIATAGNYNVTVSNPSPGGGTSTALVFVVAAPNPVPTIATISPGSATAGGSAFTLTVNGTNFISTSSVNFNGNARTTTYVSGTQLTAAIPASDIATAGTFSVTVSNPTPGGGTSNAVNFTVNNPLPTVTSLSPSTAVAGGSTFTLTVSGTGFVASSTVSFNGSARTTTFVSATQLTAAIPASDIATAGSYNVTVANPSPGGGTSTPMTFVVSAVNPVPTITTISPSSAIAGGTAFTLTVNGTGFVGSSTVNFNGNARTTTFVSATQLTAAIPASDIAVRGSYNVTVTNPSPGGGTSNVVVFTVNNPVPSITTLSPTSAASGGAAFTLTVSGTNFVTSSTVYFNGNARTTTFVSSTQLTAAIPAADIATAGNYNVTVTNPSPGGGTSAPVTFVVAAPNPVPTITTISPTTATAGSAGFTLTVNGTNFINTSTVSFNGVTRTTTFVSATQLTAAIPASDIVTAGTYNVTVTNPAPGGGTANAASFTVNNPIPTVTTIAPSTATAGGSGFTLTVNGSNFVSTSTVSFSGSLRATTFVSTTQLTAAIPASDIVTGGTFNVTVTNSAPGGGASNAVTFTANNPVPTIATISPISAVAGGSAFTVTVNGTNFVGTSSITLDGSALATVFVNATQLTATVPASLITSAKSINVTIVNPLPGGGTSNVVTFTVTDFNFAAASGGSTTATVVAGQTATYNLQLTPSNGFTGTVTLSCSGAPSLAVCSVSPSSLSVSGSTSPFSVTVTTTAPSIAGVLQDQPGPAPRNRNTAALLGMAMLTMCAGAVFSTRRMRRALAPMAAVFILMALSGCGGGGGDTTPPPTNGTPKGTYTLTVTGSSGGVNRTISLSLTVN